MPINPNIALGGQPVQQPNILGQMGQMMALRAAQQEIEGSEGVRNALSEGAPEDPTSLLQYGKQGRATYESLLKGRKEQLESTVKKIGITSSAFKVIEENPTLETAQKVFGDLVGMGAMDKRAAEGALAKVLANPTPDNIRTLARQGIEYGISAAERLTAATRIQAANIGAGPGYQRNQLDRERFNLEQADSAEIARILRGEPPTTSSAPVTPPAMMGGGGGGATTTQAAPVTSAAGRPNVLATQAAPITATAPSVNAFNPDARQPTSIDQIGALIRTGKPKAIQAADALIKQYNLENPAGKIEPDANGVLQIINERAGTSRPVIGADGKPVIAKSPFESAYTKGVGEEAAKSDVALVNSAQAAVAKLQDINQTITQLKGSDAITGFGADLLKDVERFRAQFTRDTKAGKRVADTEVLNAMLGSEVFGMIQSLGIGAKGLDTPAEREYLREVMTGTVRMDKAALIKLTEIRKNVTERAIDEYNKKLDNGELNRYFETRGISPKRIEKPSAGSTGDISVDPAIQSLLNKYK